MKRKKILAVIAAVLTLCFTLAACGGPRAADAVSLKKEVMNTEGLAANLESASNQEAIVDFAAELFGEVYDGKNAMVSPLATYLALAMVANGADGETKTQMLNALNLSEDELNAYCGYLYARYAENEKAAEHIKLANGIWYRDTYGLTAKEDFLKTNATYYGAEIYKSKFNPSSARDINRWVSNKTDGMIKKLVDKIDASAVMMLVSALFFECKWANAADYRYRDFEFTDIDGNKSTQDFFSDELSVCYYTETARAFSLPFEYVGADAGRYGFFAVLPDEEIGLEKYMEDFDGDELYSLLTTYKTGCEVYTRVPKFSFDYDTDLVTALSNMGMPIAFDADKADFGRMYDGITASNNVYIGKASTKTRIELDKNGARAAAAVKIQMGAKTAAPVEGETIYLYLDRPFMFCIMDMSANVPLFIGTVTTL